jgi:hypothetical protein
MPVSVHGSCRDPTPFYTVAYRVPVSYLVLWLYMDMVYVMVPVGSGYPVLFGSVWGPHFYNCCGHCCGSWFIESGCSISSKSGSGSRFRVLITKNWKKIQKRLSYRRILQPSKENIQQFKWWNLLTVFYDFFYSQSYSVRFIPCFNTVDLLHMAAFI